MTRLETTLCLNPRDLVFRPDNMDETVLHTCSMKKGMSQRAVNSVLGCVSHLGDHKSL